MTCEKIQEQLLTGAPLDADAREHLVTCEACQEASTRLVLFLKAAAPETPNPVELGLLNGLAHQVTTRGVQRARTRALFRTAASYGVAASVGGAIVAAVLFSHQGPAAPLTQHALHTWEAPVIELASVDASNDEVGFEVEWPTLNEGETQ